MNPLISIIIPVYNRATLIEATLNSIIKQTYTNWECIIVDDHSIDNTFLVLSSFTKIDARIKAYRRPTNKPKGPSSCRNFGFEKSNGQFINWFDSDDLMVNNKLELDLKNITTGDFDFTISQSQFFDETNNEKLDYWNNSLFSKNAINDFILLKIGWSTNAPLWKRASLEKNNLIFDERLITADDYFYHIQALEYKLKPIVCDKVLVCQRVHLDRLENLKVKSTYKLIVNYYLLNHQKVLELENETIISLKNQSLAQLGNLFKNKEWLKGVYFSLKFLRFLIEFKYLKKIFSLLLIGTFFKITSKGYSLLK